MIRERLRAAKRRELIEPSIYCDITDKLVVIRVDGLDWVSVSECVIAVVEAGCFPESVSF